MEKISNKLAGWRSKCLSMAGRATLIKSVVQVYPYLHNAVPSNPWNITDMMDRKIRNFFWGKDDTKPHQLFFKSWDAVCRPKNLGGMGFRKMHDLNIALISKQGWSLVSSHHKQWVKLIRSKYLRGRRHFNLEQTVYQTSWIWNGISRTREFLSSGLCFQLGRNSTTSIWSDP